jgi:simple sugar transport system permease protein
MYGLGFIGIGVALMGRNNPIGIIFAGIFFSNLVIGGQNMQTSIGVAKELTDALIGILIIALAFPLAYRMLLRYIKIRKGVHE